uniref:Zinc finger protein 177 n=2 Tax=Cacopsylla melanoneura TaxID=428564 RepID=A0A8D8LRM1_9HEMI
METRERQYGIECFDKLNPNHLENESMGIFVDFKTQRMSSSTSDSDNDLTIRRSVDEELALSDDSSDEDHAVQSPYHMKNSSSYRICQVSQFETRRNSDSENEDSDDDLRVNHFVSKSNVLNIPTNGVKLPLNNKPQSLSSCSSYSSEHHSDVIDVSDSSDDDSRERSPYSCQYCRKEFRSNADLTRHVRCHTGERPYNCDHCSKSFSQSAHLRRHLLTHPDKVNEHKCLLCSKSYPLKLQLIGHMAVHSKKEPKVKTKFKCEYCQKTLATHHKYKKHVAAHVNGNLHCCDVCGRSFKMQSYLIVHKRTHTQTKVYTGDRPFVCTECGKGFLSSSNLELHATIHKYERTSFPCEICGKEFSRKSNYVAHAKSHYR